MVKITDNKKVCEILDKMLNNSKRVQIEYNHQNGTVKLFDCTPKIVKIDNKEAK